MTKAVAITLFWMLIMIGFVVALVRGTIPWRFDIAIGIIPMLNILSLAAFAWED